MTKSENDVDYITTLQTNMSLLGADCCAIRFCAGCRSNYWFLDVVDIGYVNKDFSLRTRCVMSSLHPSFLILCAFLGWCHSVGRIWNSERKRLFWLVNIITALQQLCLCMELRVWVTVFAQPPNWGWKIWGVCVFATNMVFISYSMWLCMYVVTQELFLKGGLCPESRPCRTTVW